MGTPPTPGAVLATSPRASRPPQAENPPSSDGFVRFA